MKGKLRKLAAASLVSISCAMSIFCLVGIVFDVRFKGSFSLDNYSFTKMVIGCIIIGLGFGAPTVVYESESLPMPVKVLIHMGIGCVVYTVVAFAVGWIGNAKSIWEGIAIAAAQLLAVFVIRLLFTRHYRMEAKRMNDRLQEMKH